MLWRFGGNEIYGVLSGNFRSEGDNLSLKLTEVEELSARTLAQEKEKQEILSRQKETLEIQVAERTSEIMEQKTLLEHKNKDITDSINEIILKRGITTPSEILSELRFKVIDALKQKGETGEQKDGMDIALLAFDDEKNIVEFAGANNSLLRCTIKNGTPEMETFPADKRPIGYFLGKGLPFTGHKTEMRKGDAYYIFSDGFADQFGGEKGKKFKRRRLGELLLSIQHEPMRKQEEILLQKFYAWKGRLDQVDDVLVIGVRI